MREVSESLAGRLALIELTPFLSREVSAWGLPAKPATTQRLTRMLAAVHGQRWNVSQIGKSLGVNYQTVNSYLDDLEGAFLIRRLPPYPPNLGKRLTKSPKVFWHDPGLLHALLGVTDRDDLPARPWVGASWEGFVVEQIIGHLAADGRACDATHFRPSDGHEADLRKLQRVALMVGASRALLICRVPHPLDDGHLHCGNLPSALEVIVARR